MWLPNDRHKVVIHCRQMSSLDVYMYFVHCWNVTDVEIGFIVTNCHHLTSICLTCCSSATNNILHAIGRHCHAMLRSICIYYDANITDDGLWSLAKCTRLRSLTISKCDQITDDGVMGFVSTCQELTRLSITCCKQLTVKSAHCQMFQICRV